MKRKVIALLWLITAAGTTVAFPAKITGKQGSFQHDASVTLKLIQVYVTDKDGRPVRDLTKEDFTVFDDRRAVSLTEFERHVFLEAGSEIKSRAEAEPAAPLAVPTVSPNAMSRKFILFFDFAYNDQRGATAGLKAAGRFLETDVLPGDEVAVVSYSALKGLRIHEFLTRDRIRAGKALADLASKEIAGRTEEIEQLYWQAAEEGFDNLSPAARHNLNWQRQEAKSLAGNYFTALAALAKAMRLIEGQKNFLFFSTGLPYSLIFGAVSGQVEYRSKFDMGDPILRPLSEGLLKEFNAANCSIFSFDTRAAAKVQSLFAYEELRTATGGGGAFSAAGVSQSQTDVFRDDKTTGQDVLRRFSKETGGQYFSNIGLFEENLETVRNLTGTYYVLGYPIGTPKDGEYHKIKVEVKRKDCRVKAQGGYFNPKPFSEYSELEKQIHLFDLALNERAEGRARREFGVAALSYDAGSEPQLRLISRIPRETVASFEGGKVEFVALTFDEQGNPVGLERKTADLEASRGREVLFTSGTNPPPGRYQCRVIIRDLKSGDSAVASAEANVAKPAAAGLRLATPLLLVPGEAPVSLEAGRRGSLESPSWREIYACGDTGLVPVTAEFPPSGKAVVVVPCTVGDGPAKAEYSARLIGMSDGKAQPFEWTETGRSRAGNLETARFELSLTGLPPGRYQLYIHAVDPARGLQAQSHLPLVIRSSAD